VINDHEAGGDLIGRMLGPYGVKSLLGRGGMGEVYEAWDSRLKRRVAIKVLSKEFRGDSDRAVRFRREAETLASLNHSGIASIYDLVNFGDSLCLILELVEGPTLADRIRPGPLSLQEAMTIARGIGEALEAAHERGIVHRDLKPANVKAAPGGAAKVLDFGIAKIVATTDGLDQSEIATGLTATEAGVILGTTAYMAPEQVRGQPVDRRADIWSFGVILYEMLTGEKPFSGTSVSDTFALILTQQPNLDRLPLQVRKLVGKCLEKEPRRRLRDIGDAWELLENRIEPVAPARGAWSWIPWAVAGLSVVVSVFVLLRTQPPESRPVRRFTMNDTDVLTFGGIALSPDGLQIAYVNAHDSQKRLWIRALEESEGKPIAGTDGAQRPFFSPNGQSLAFFIGERSGSLKIVRAIGADTSSRGVAMELCRDADFFGGAWGKDRIVFSNSKGLMEVPPTGGECKPITHATSGEFHRFPQILPGGRSVLFTIGSDGAFDSAQLAVVDLASGHSDVVVNGGTAGHYVTSGHLVYIRGGDMFALPFDMDRRTPAGKESRVLDGVFYNSSGGFACYTVSDDGLLIYAGDRRRLNTVGQTDRAGTFTPLSMPAEGYGGLRVAPDGKHVVLFLASTTDIKVLDLATGALSLVVSEGINLAPIWAPDSVRVTFRVHGQGIYWTPFDGRLKPEQLVQNADVFPNSWTPDGSELFYSVQDKDIWAVPMIAGKPGAPHSVLDASNYSEREAQVSPDGKLLAYQSDESGEPKIYVRSLPDLRNKVAVSPASGVTPRWSSKSSELFYRDPKINRLMLVSGTSPQIRTDSPQSLFTLGDVPWDVMPDGKRFLVIQAPTGNDSQQPLNVVENWFEELHRKSPVSK
jgi:serine/threonine-protein kinase